MRPELDALIEEPEDAVDVRELYRRLSEDDPDMTVDRFIHMMATGAQQRRSEQEVPPPEPPDLSRFEEGAGAGPASDRMQRPTTPASDFLERTGLDRAQQVFSVVDRIARDFVLGAEAQQIRKVETLQRAGPLFERLNTIASVAQDFREGVGFQERMASLRRLGLTPEDFIATSDRPDLRRERAIRGILQRHEADFRERTGTPPEQELDALTLKEMRQAAEQEYARATAPPPVSPGTALKRIGEAGLEVLSFTDKPRQWTAENIWKRVTPYLPGSITARQLERVGVPSKIAGPLGEWLLHPDFGIAGAAGAAWGSLSEDEKAEGLSYVFDPAILAMIGMGPAAKGIDVALRESPNLARAVAKRMGNSAFIRSAIAWGREGEAGYWALDWGPELYRGGSVPWKAGRLHPPEVIPPEQFQAEVAQALGMPAGPPLPRKPVAAPRPQGVQPVTAEQMELLIKSGAVEPTPAQRFTREAAALGSEEELRRLPTRHFYAPNADLIARAEAAGIPTPERLTPNEIIHALRTGSLPETLHPSSMRRLMPHEHGYERMLAENEPAFPKPEPREVPVPEVTRDHVRATVTAANSDDPLRALYHMTMDDLDALGLPRVEPPDIATVIRGDIYARESLPNVRGIKVFGKTFIPEVKEPQMIAEMRAVTSHINQFQAEQNLVREALQETTVRANYIPADDISEQTYGVWRAVSDQVAPPEGLEEVVNAIHQRTLVTEAGFVSDVPGMAHRMLNGWYMNRTARPGLKVLVETGEGETAWIPVRRLEGGEEAVKAVGDHVVGVRGDMKRIEGTVKEITEAGGYSDFAPTGRRGTGRSFLKHRVRKVDEEGELLPLTFEQFIALGEEPLTWNIVEQELWRELIGYMYREQYKSVQRLRAAGRLLPTRLNTEDWIEVPWAAARPNPELAEHGTRMVASPQLYMHKDDWQVAQYMWPGYHDGNLGPLQGMDNVLANVRKANLMGTVFQHQDLTVRGFVNSLMHLNPVRGMTDGWQAWRIVGDPTGATLRAYERWSATDPWLVHLRREGGLMSASGGDIVAEEQLSLAGRMTELERAPFTRYFDNLPGIGTKGQALTRLADNAYAFVQRGLFRGVYRVMIERNARRAFANAAKRTETWRALARANAEMDETALFKLWTKQHGDEAARISSQMSRRFNERFSSKPLWQRAFKGPLSRFLLRRARMGPVEFESLTAHALRPVIGPDSADAARWWLSMYLTIGGVAEMLNMATTGRHLGMHQLLPFRIQGTDVRSLQFNSQFLRPNLGAIGAHGVEDYLDLLGQMDYPLRAALDPIFFAEAGLSPELSATWDIVRGHDFWGNPIWGSRRWSWQSGRGVGLRLLDMVTPIGIKGFFDERGRVGWIGSLIQMLGPNVNIERFGQLKDRVAQEMGYDSYQEASPKAQEKIDGDPRVEARRAVFDAQVERQMEAMPISDKVILAKTAIGSINEEFDSDLSLIVQGLEVQKAPESLMGREATPGVHGLTPEDARRQLQKAQANKGESMAQARQMNPEGFDEMQGYTGKPKGKRQENLRGWWDILGDPMYENASDDPVVLAMLYEELNAYETGLPAQEQDWLFEDRTAGLPGPIVDLMTDMRRCQPVFDERNAFWEKARVDPDMNLPDEAAYYGTRSGFWMDVYRENLRKALSDDEVEPSQADDIARKVADAATKTVDDVLGVYMSNWFIEHPEIARLYNSLYGDLRKEVEESLAGAEEQTAPPRPVLE